MFIALINEVSFTLTRIEADSKRHQNFEVAEEQKRDRQIQEYIRRAEPTVNLSSWMDRFNPYLRSLRRSGPKIPGTERAKRGKSILHPKKPSHSHNRAGSIADQIERVVSATSRSDHNIYLPVLTDNWRGWYGGCPICPHRWPAWNDASLHGHGPTAGRHALDDLEH